MKKIIIASVLVIFISAAFNVPAPEKKYKLEYSLQEWNSKLQALQNAQEIMRKSSYPGTEISRWQDSIMSIIQDINKQVSAQVAADTVTPKTIKSK